MLELRNIRKSFQEAEHSLTVLQDVSLQVNRGEVVALVGASGSGKTTLLQIAGLLSTADGGEILLDGTPATQASDKQRTQWRRDKIGFVYQFHQLLPEFSALENIILPQRIAGISPADAKDRAMQLLASLGMEARAEHRPAKLSGGEQQRVALARAMANRPLLLLADEPTGNLDSDNAQNLIAQLHKLAESEKTALLIATHDTALAKQANRMVRLTSGTITTE
jgi:lipoprotein-releasing system ATP-binding protein